MDMQPSQPPSPMFRIRALAPRDEARPGACRRKRMTLLTKSASAWSSTSSAGFARAVDSGGRLRKGAAAPLRAFPTVGEHPFAEQLDRVHDLLVRGAARVGVPQPEQVIVRPRSVPPAMELAHARLGVAQDEAVGSEIGQSELHLLRNVSQLP